MMSTLYPNIANSPVARYDGADDASELRMADRGCLTEAEGSLTCASLSSAILLAGFETKPKGRQIYPAIIIRYKNRFLAN